MAINIEDQIEGQIKSLKLFISTMQREYDAISKYGYGEEIPEKIQLAIIRLKNLVKTEP